MKKLYKIITYGCQMNVHESEKIAGKLSNLGFVSTDITEDADIIVFNTCCIRDTAEKKILGNIGAIKPLKEKNKDIIVVVVGCMSQQDEVAINLKKKFKFIDIILGTNNLDLLECSLLARINEHKITVEIDNNPNPQIIERDTPFRTSGVNAWVNIMYGCNNFCTYCIVPLVRGRERSREPEKIIDEVKNLVSQGYKEITLLGQNVNSYCKDKDNKYTFAMLLSNIAIIEGNFRIRFMTSHPKDLTKDIIDVIKKYPKICNYIHLPVQAGSTKVLDDMNRKYTREQYLEIIKNIRQELPNVGITTDIMVGFPTETEEDFLQTLELVTEVKFSMAFTYIYSPRRGTVAAKMTQIPYEIKKERIKRLIVMQDAITLDVSHSFIGKTVCVLIEDVSKKSDKILCGRTECGRLVCFAGDKNLIGQFVDVKINFVKSACLWGDIVNG